MQGNILLCYPVILHSQVILPSDLTCVSAFHVQRNFLSGFSAVLPSGDVIAVSAVAVVSLYDGLFILDS